MFVEDRSEVKQMIDSALAGFKIPEVKAPREFDDSSLREEIASLKKEVVALKGVKPASKKLGG